MEIDGFNEVAGIIALAKELHDVGRFDVVENNFFDTLSSDVWFEDVFGVISSVFSGFYSNYSDDEDAEIMVFTDDVISDYYRCAWEFGVKTNTPFEENPYAKEAKREVDRRLDFCYSMGWKLLGYTKTRRTAGQSKLVVYMGMCECNCHTKLAYGLIQIYQWFSDKVAAFKKRVETADSSIDAIVCAAVDVTTGVTAPAMIDETEAMAA